MIRRHPWVVKSVVAAIGLVVTNMFSPVVAGPVKAHDTDKDWRGWWFMAKEKT